MRPQHVVFQCSCKKPANILYLHGGKSTLSTCFRHFLKHPETCVLRNVHHQIQVAPTDKRHPACCLKKIGAVSKDRLFSLPQLRRMLEVLMRVTIRHNQRLETKGGPVYHTQTIASTYYPATRTISTGENYFQKHLILSYVSTRCKGNL